MCTTTPGEDAFWWAYGLFAKERPPTERCSHKRGVLGKGYYFCQRERKHRGEHAYENPLVGQTATGRRPSEPEFQNIPYSGAAGKAFQRLLEEAAGTCVGIPCTYQQPWPCSIDACEEIWCGEHGFRNFCYPHAARMKAFLRNARQGCGQQVGHQIAIDALVALASAPYPVSLIDGVGTAEETREAKEDFDRAARQALLKIIQESIADSQPEGRWCILHQGYHPFSEGMCCWVREDADEAPVRELTEEEGRALFREQCWRYMNMSAEEFARKWHAGEFDDDPDRSEVMRVVMLLPLFDRRKAP